MAGRPKSCVFCGGGPLTREHFWPEWMHEHLPPRTEEAHYQEKRVHDEKSRLAGPPRRVDRQGGTQTITMRSVCARCNNGWMSNLEGESAPTLLRLMRGEPLRLEGDELLTTARWLILKVLIADSREVDETVSTFAERAAFRSEYALPLGLTIRIGRVAAGAWSGTFVRHSLTLAADPKRPPPGFRRNVHYILFGLGDLFVVALVSSSAVVSLGGLDGRLPAVVPITPGQGVNWPPAPISATEANRIAQSMSNLVASDRVKWMPMPEHN